MSAVTGDLQLCKKSLSTVASYILTGIIWHGSVLKTMILREVLSFTLSTVTRKCRLRANAGPISSELLCYYCIARLFLFSDSSSRDHDKTSSCGCLPLAHFRLTHIWV